MQGSECASIGGKYTTGKGQIDIPSISWSGDCAVDRCFERGRYLIPKQLRWSLILPGGVSVSTNGASLPLNQKSQVQPWKVGHLVSTSGPKIIPRSTSHSFAFDLIPVEGTGTVSTSTYHSIQEGNSYFLLLWPRTNIVSWP